MSPAAAPMLGAVGLFLLAGAYLALRPRFPSIGSWLAGAAALWVVGFLAWSIATGSLLAPAGNGDTDSEGCGTPIAC